MFSPGRSRLSLNFRHSIWLKWSPSNHKGLDGFVDKYRTPAGQVVNILSNGDHDCQVRTPPLSRTWAIQSRKPANIEKCFAGTRLSHTSRPVSKRTSRNALGATRVIWESYFKAGCCVDFTTYSRGLYEESKDRNQPLLF